jgi:hypothetical protein
MNSLGLLDDLPRRSNIQQSLFIFSLPQKSFRMLSSSLHAGLCTIALLSGQVAARPAAATTGLNSDESLPLRGPSIVEVRSAYRNVFPAKDFNRNVTTTWWQTDVLDGDASQNATSLKKALKDASFIVLNKDMYKVRE